MLSSLSIKNYAIIDELDIDFKSRLSVITGETGAGKSIIMGALGLVLGERADSKSLKDNDKKCLIEVCFEIAEYQLQGFFSENDIDYDDSTIIRREILTSGKSRSFINDTPVSLNTLKELGEQLIDIHSQHENLLLKDNSFQLKVVDIIAQNAKELQSYQDTFYKYKKVAHDLSKLISTSKQNAADKEYLQFQFEQLVKAELKEDEQAELEEEQAQLTHAEEIKLELNKIQEFLSNDEQGAVLALKESLSAAKKLEKYLTEANEYSERLNSCYIDLKDLTNDIENKQSQIHHDPQRIEFINERLDTIYTLQQKHQVDSIKTLLSLKDEFEAKLNKIENSDEEISLLQKELDALHKTSITLAEKLTRTRDKAGKQISQQMVEQLNLLGMPNVKFEVKISPKEELGTSGFDQIEFLFSANKDSSAQAVAKIASGGEIARVMLSLKALIANTKALPTIIFDEIDTGISGEVANKMGVIMKQMSDNMQVICITHLPQIASKGNHQFKVYKENSITNIRNLSTTERVNEIALMLSGSSLSEEAVANAKRLLSDS